MIPNAISVLYNPDMPVGAPFSLSVSCLGFFMYARTKSMPNGITIAAAITTRKNTGKFVSNTELTTVVALTKDALLVVAGTAEIFEILEATLVNAFVALFSADVALPSILVLLFCVVWA